MLLCRLLTGRGTDFVGGIDNEALDFSQLEDFINSEGSQGNSSYFGESLNSTPTSGKLLNVIVENKRNTNGHSLPESPPDSSSEHPYSPQDGCEAPITAAESIYTNLTQSIYKPTILSPILTDNLILGSHIVVTDQNSEHQLLDNGNILQDNRLLVGGDIRNNTRPILLPTTESAQNFDRGIYKNEDYEKNMVHLSYNHNIDSLQRGSIENNLCEQNLDNIQGVYTNLQSAPKKEEIITRFPFKHCATSQLSPSEQLSSSIDEEYASSEACLSESQYQCIRFNAFQQTNWHLLCDQNLTELPIPHYRVDADKGFNFSNADDAFVCQKKNHFQITCHVQLLGDAQFVKTPDGFQKISSFHLHFYGVKHDCPTQTIRVEQSQSDRSKKPFHPVLVELVNSQVTKVTVGRLHFSETTSNNMRKKESLTQNKDTFRFAFYFMPALSFYHYYFFFFKLVVGLHAHTTNGNFPVISHASQKIIVRASNPGQFESDVELCWQKGQTQDSVVHNGRVGINTDRPDESLVVHGNIKITGHIIQPSDIRAKKNIVECNTAEQLKNVQKLRVVSRSSECSDTGVIAQEVAQVLPEAVKPAGNLVLENGTSIDNFLVVNKERIFMENIGAVKELCKVTDNLETRIDQLERINRRLNKLKRGDSLKSTSTGRLCREKNGLSSLMSLFLVNSSKLSYSHKCSKHHHSCHKEEELCSNKFIQIVIVVLVLIMAFCLAAITTLYLMEAARHTQYMQTNIDGSHRNHVTKRPTKSTKMHTWPSTLPPYHSTNSYKEDEITKITLDANIMRPSFIIGRPLDCLTVEQDLESTNLCQIYCCANPPQRPPQEITTSLFSEKKPPSANRNKTGPLLNVEKNKIAKTFHSNDIDKQIRQKKGHLCFPKCFTNINFFLDDQIFTIIIQGRHFNTTLTHKYRKVVSNPQFNFSYSVPISKYMPDEFINLIFRSNPAIIKEIEHCYNDYKQHECPFLSPMYYDDKSRIRHKVNENSPSQLLSLQSVIFEVDMADFQSKVMTYRVSLHQSQNVCKLSATKLGLEYAEYNFHFYRHCDE
ncbi:hypothetical protein NQ314_011023 [Rhamnusium bicolor]|uniref:Myelin regulatory factor-like protein n=1 Tax=Rhamnusium bicolor TaxID=1586634 RepID=A0AAV8XLE6_9CUCU|nr:hypothetical protein NQ314_011023 [Rhamnusium bicolor]